MARRLTANEVAFILALVAGLLFIATGYSGARGIFRLYDLVNEFVGASPALRFVGLVLVGIAALGGFTVIAGGLAILQDQVWAGRILIYLGAGGGLVTLMTFAWLLFNRPGFVLAHETFIPVAIGISLCVVAQWKARPPRAAP